VLATGGLYIADLESAKRHVQTVTAPGVVAEPRLEVILQDLRVGNSGVARIWGAPKGPSSSPPSNALSLGDFSLEPPDHPAECRARIFLIFCGEIGKCFL
jgi:hypothetical protein